MSGDEGWLDMSRYPEMDPEEVLPPTALTRLRDILLEHEVSEVPPLRGAGLGDGQPSGGGQDRDGGLR